MTWMARGSGARDTPWPTPQDYNEAIQNPATSFEEGELRRGHAVTMALGIPKAITGNFATVYQVKTGRSVHAVRCFLRNVPDQRERYELISRHLAAAGLKQTVEFSFIAQGIRVRGSWYPILKMDWVTGTTLAAYIEKHLGEAKTITKLTEEFLDLLDDLRTHQIAHGDLQHGNLLVVDEPSGPKIKVIDYDGMWVPALDGLKSNEVGHPNYQHPSRTRDDYGQTLDSFSAWSIVASLIAVRADPTVWASARPHGADDRLLVGKTDYLDRGGSSAFRQLLTTRDVAAKQAMERLAALCPPNQQVLGLPPPGEEDLRGGRALQWLPGAPEPSTGGAWWKPAGSEPSPAATPSAASIAAASVSIASTAARISPPPGSPSVAAASTSSGFVSTNVGSIGPAPAAWSTAPSSPVPPPTVPAKPKRRRKTASTAQSVGAVPSGAAAPTAMAALASTGAAALPPSAAASVTPFSSVRHHLRKDLVLALAAVGIIAAVVIGASNWRPTAAAAPPADPTPAPTAAPSTEGSPSLAAAVVPTAQPRPTARPTPRVAPTATPVVPTPSPRPTVKPTPSPGPNAKPAKLEFGHAYYTSAGCWSSEWTDSSGTNFDLVSSDIRLTVSNTGQRPSDFLWIKVVTSGARATNPSYSTTNWADQHFYYQLDDRSMLLGGPQIQPGEARELQWRSLFETKDDVTYTITVLPGPDPAVWGRKSTWPTFARDPVHKPWTFTTTNKPCP